MSDLRLAATHEIDPATLAAARALLDDAFGSDYTDHDWEHGLGGTHVLVHEGDRLIGHGSVVGRTLWVGERELHAGYAEGVGVAGDRRRRGIAKAIMTALGEVIRTEYELGALSATEEGMPLYTAMGWELWTGPSSVRNPDGTITPTPDDDGGIFVLRAAAELDLTAPITCDWRAGDVW
jgi:aminoglycoside 2'-N-acetyltransferase I